MPSRTRRTLLAWITCIAIGVTVAPAAARAEGELLRVPISTHSVLELPVPRHWRNSVWNRRGQEIVIRLWPTKSQRPTATLRFFPKRLNEVQRSVGHDVELRVARDLERLAAHNRAQRRIVALEGAQAKGQYFRVDTDRDLEGKPIRGGRRLYGIVGHLELSDFLISYELLSDRPAIAIQQAFIDTLERSDVRPTELGLVVHHALENPKDTTLARLESEAMVGDPHAATLLATYYEAGIGVAKNQTRAREWIERAARLEHAPALARLGTYYREGTGVPRDLGRAAQLFDRARKQRDGDGAYRLAFMVLNGEGVPKNPARAFELAQEAVMYGDVEGMALLGQLYLYGIGTERDLDEAAFFLGRAAELGSESALELARKIEAAGAVPASTD